MGWLGSEVCGIPKNRQGRPARRRGCAGACRRTWRWAAVLPEEALAELVEELPEELLLGNVSGSAAVRVAGRAVGGTVGEIGGTAAGAGRRRLLRGLGSRGIGVAQGVGGEPVGVEGQRGAGSVKGCGQLFRHTLMDTDEEEGAVGLYQRFGRKTLMRSGLASRVSLPSSVSPDSAQGRDRRTGSGYSRPPGSSVRRFCPPGRSPPSKTALPP